MCSPAKFGLETTGPVSRVIWPKPVELIKASLAKVLFQKILKSKMFRQKSSQEVLSIVQPNSAQLFSRVRIKELSQHLTRWKSPSTSYKKTSKQNRQLNMSIPYKLNINWEESIMTHLQRSTRYQYTREMSQISWHSNYVCRFLTTTERKQPKK